MIETILSDELQDLFTKQLQDTRRTILVGSVVVIGVLLYEGSRLRDLSFEAARLPIYLLLLPLMVYVLLVGPARAYRKGKRLVRSYRAEPNGGPVHFETIHDEVISCDQPMAAAEKEIMFRGQPYIARTFRVYERELWFLLTQKG